MTQADFERELASATGESVHTIRRRGFSLIEMPEREPFIIDWDQPPHSEPARPYRRKRTQRVAA